MAVLTNYLRTFVDGELVVRINNNLPAACLSWIIIMLALIVSIQRPELWNQQRSILCSYLASWIGVFTFILIRGSLIAAFGLDGLNTYCKAYIDFGVSYFSTATMLWLNVMIHATWKMFRDYSHNQNVIIDESRTSRFVLYSVYAWVCSGLEIAITLYTTFFSDVDPEVNYKLYAEWGILTFLRFFAFVCIVVCNITLFISISRVIEGQGYEMPVTNSSAEVKKDIKKWVASCKKLFLLAVMYEILAIPILFEVSLLDVGLSLEMMHGIPIFLMFV